MADEILLITVGAAVLGVVGQWLGWRLKLPAIVPLLAIGALLGPVFGIVRPSEALGAVMHPAIGMAVAIIVFEGGLNLNLRELRSAGSGVMRLVLVALPLNWALGTAAAHWLGGMAWPVALLVGAILVVTGPTVIMPLLRQARLAPRAASFLKWEAIVNDPIGATLTLLVLSYLTLSTQMSGAEAAWTLAWRTALGGSIAAVLGFAVPFGIRALFRRDLAPEYLKTPILLAGALGVYAAGEAIQPETGLIGATLFGVVLANIDVTGLQELKRFKESLTVFLVSGLFILLTANIDRQVVEQLSWPILLTTAAILFVVRPLSILLATLGAHVSWRERLLVGWIGPRGVVAAAIAGVAQEQLSAAGYAGAELVLPLVFAVIASTVVLHGLGLGPLARKLGLASKARSGVLIVGASDFTTALAAALRRAEVPVLLVDRSLAVLKPARRLGIRTLHLEVLSAVGEELVDLREMHHLLAATPDDAYNALVCTRFAPELGRERVWQLAPNDGGGNRSAARDWRGRILLAEGMTFDRLAEAIAGGARIVASESASDAATAEVGPVADNARLPQATALAVIGSGDRFAFCEAGGDPAGVPGDKVLHLQTAPVMGR